LELKAKIKPQGATQDILTLFVTLFLTFKKKIQNFEPSSCISNKMEPLINTSSLPSTSQKNSIISFGLQKIPQKCSDFILVLESWG